MVEVQDVLLSIENIVRSHRVLRIFASYEIDIYVIQRNFNHIYQVSITNCHSTKFSDELNVFVQHEFLMLPAGAA